MTGMQGGRLYCQELFEHDDSWQIEDKFGCFTKYGVKFGKEYCDYKIPSKDRFQLM